MQNPKIIQVKIVNSGPQKLLGKTAPVKSVQLLKSKLEESINKEGTFLICTLRNFPTTWGKGLLRLREGCFGL